MNDRTGMEGKMLVIVLYVAERRIETTPKLGQEELKIGHVGIVVVKSLLGLAFRRIER